MENPPLGACWNAEWDSPSKEGVPEDGGVASCPWVSCMQLDALPNHALKESVSTTPGLVRLRGERRGDFRRTGSCSRPSVEEVTLSGRLTGRPVGFSS